MRKVSVVCSKGGTGKSTTAVNVAAGLARAGRRTLLVDCDAQGSASAHLGAAPGPGLYEVLRGEATCEQARQAVRERLDLIPASLTLSAASVYLMQQKNPVSILRRRFQEIADYDFVILDCAPNFSALHSNVLLYVDEAWIPVSMEYLALLGVAQLVNELSAIADELETSIKIAHVIPTFYDARNRKTTQIMEMLREQFPAQMTSPIRTDVRLSEAPGTGRTIYEYAPKSRGASDYQKLVEEVSDVEKVR